MNRILGIIAFVSIAGLGIGAALDSRPAPKEPVDVYAKLNGRWRGTFVGYDLKGTELYRIQVEQEYYRIDEETQGVRVKDTMPDGKVITGEGENTARRLPSGELELRCVVRKSNGEKVEHQGKLVTGVDGTPELIWYSQSSKKREVFRELVREEGNRKVYSIDGFGAYGESEILMHGRYYRDSK